MNAQLSPPSPTIPHQSDLATPEDWRNRVLDRFLLLMAPLSVLTAIVDIWSQWSLGLEGMSLILIATELVGMIIIPALLIMRRLPISIRALTPIAFLYIIGLVDLFQVGVNSDSRYLFLLCVLFTTVFFSNWAGSAVFSSVLGAMIIRLTFFGPGKNDPTLDTAIGDIFIFSYICALVVIPLVLLVQGLTQSTQRALISQQTAEAANQAKSRFLANMSHELRTPLNAILGFTQLMQRDQKLDTTQQEHLTIVNRSGEHLLLLINDVLEMSKIEAGRVTLDETDFDLHRFLRSLQAMFQLRASEKGLDLFFDGIAQAPRFIRADESKLRQVLVNLVGNAIKFTDQGCVTVRVSLQKMTPHHTNGATSPPDHCLHFDVIDTGPGIAPDEQARLFEPFKQSDQRQRAQEGTGLGLAISRQFVQLMGGEIEVESEFGVGSTFQFDVPVHLAQASLERQPAAEHVVGVMPNQPTYRLLVAEDHPENQTLLVKLFEPFNFEIQTATTGVEAVALWETWQPDLIWMDMRMPEMDGLTATKRIKTLDHDNQTTIIALTASAFEEERKNILAAGCDDFVRKPFQEDVIFEKITRHLGVEFVYEQKRPDLLPENKQLPLTPKMLTQLPPEASQELYQVARSIDLDGANQIIRKLQTSHPTIARGLQQLVDEFRFDTLQHLLEQNDEEPNFSKT